MYPGAPSVAQNYNDLVRSEQSDFVTVYVYDR
jgi:hypothetical protein